MIRKLRQKFVLINMSLVTIVLLILFTTLCLSNYRQLKAESENALYAALDDHGGNLGNEPFDKKGNDGNPKPYEKKAPQRPFAEDSYLQTFCVLIDAKDQSQQLLNVNGTVDETQISAAVEQALATEDDSGVLSEMELRFLKEKTSFGTKLAFVDIQNERTSMTRLVFISLIVGVGALAAFFLISLFLSRLAVRPVEDAWNRQQQFVADASHELKTPLTVILANTDILRAHPDKSVGEQEKWLEYIRAEAERMRGLVENLLFLAKTDATATATQHCRLSLSDVTWSCLLPFESVAYEKGVRLSADVTDDVTVFGDKRQLEQLLVILLDNACKYTDAGGTVTVQLRTAGDKLRLTVNNVGGAILSKEEQAHLFERFYRVDKARTREQGGYGLGLSIAQSIAEVHNGKIAVESSAEQGTTFTVTLPLAKG